MTDPVLLVGTMLLGVMAIRAIVRRRNRVMDCGNATMFRIQVGPPSDYRVSTSNAEGFWARPSRRYSWHYFKTGAGHSLCGAITNEVRYVRADMSDAYNVLRQC